MTVWLTRIACCILKATNTHSEYVIIIASPLQQRLYWGASMLRYTFFASLVTFQKGLAKSWTYWTLCGEYRLIVLKSFPVFHWLILLLEYFYNVENNTEYTRFILRFCTSKYVIGTCLFWNTDSNKIMDITTKNTRVLRRQKSFKWFKHICQVSTWTPTGQNVRNFVRIFSNSLIYKIKVFHSGSSAVS